MNFPELYLPLKYAHVSLVAISIGWFILRGALKIFGPQRVSSSWSRLAPHFIDALLLSSGIGLALLIQQYPISHHWLTVKMFLLVAYVVLGIKTMRSTRPRQQRVYFAAAVLCALLMVTVASSH
ncbi:MAG: SirB2 family protein [Bermanella sp.]|jgi:Uncharacterized protein conserved in bacteria